MEKEIINSIRMGFKEELEKSEGLPKRLKLSNEVAREILFDTDEMGMKTFAFPLELMKKIDFTGISFDEFFAYGFNFTGFTGISLDPQKVFDKDLSYANLNGVTIINTFDGVSLEGTEYEGMNYKTWKIRAKKYAKTMKK